MKKHHFSIILTLALLATTLVGFRVLDQEPTSYQWKQITTVESVVPAGLGRSRMITVDSEGKMEEVKMKNFFSISGINFGNVRENDQSITDKITELGEEGWELHTVTPGVYGADKSTGIFITRYLFRKKN